MSDEQISGNRDRRAVKATNSLWDKANGGIRPNGDEPNLPYPSIPAVFIANAKRIQNDEFAVYREGPDSPWLTLTWEQAAIRVALIAKHLRENLGVKKGDRVAILSNTRVEWALADLAALSVGAVAVSVYHSLTAEEAGFILWDSDSFVVFAENAEQWEKVRDIATQHFHVPETESFAGGQVSFAVRAVITFEKVRERTPQEAPSEVTPRLPERTGLDEILASELSFNAATELLSSYTEELVESDLACLVYTSGTTAAPKGVIQTHRNHLEMLRSVLRSGLMMGGKKLFLYLPLAHSFAKLCLYAAMAPGGSVIFPTVVDRERSRFNPQQVMRDLADSSPIIFPSVPRIFEKIMEGLSHPEGTAQKLGAWAVQTVAKYRKQDPSKLPFWKMIKIRIAERLLEKVRTKLFGSRLAYCVSGGAPISKETLQFFDAMGVLICEGYGLTETTPAMAANIPRWRKIGTVGRLFDCNEVRIAALDGEIEVRGGNIAEGYWKLPKATAEAWDSERWFKTGDIGEIDEDGYLAITDRKKDLIVLAGGKKVPPTLLEGKLKTSPYISQVLVYGDRRPYLVALLTLSEENLKRYLGAGAEDVSGLEALSKLPEVYKLVEAEVAKVNRTLASFEQIKRFALLPEDFTLENGLLTPSLKLKRKVATERFQNLIDPLYVGGRE